VDSTPFCPNCGELLEFQSQVSEFNCSHCGEALRLSSDHKLILVKPIETYMVLEETPGIVPEGPWEGNVAQPIPAISPQRKRRAAELALQRIANQERDVVRGFFYGSLFVVFGGIFILASSLRWLFVSDDWLNLVGLGLGLVLIPVGIYFGYWFYRSSQALKRDEEEIKREIIRSK